ncbi:Holliday junction branch migration protein RuvA [Corynebacterium poyangense]|uniref:Holliday junction branch migration complex subunit RuvA n=1 Tax=Corynebacterium poyangense TaxID=2684405 RepID=A0A7H0SP54_9CORY|nr:Holliday junction branch migration protein RuvA [Corynebacterium poyangense]QNQ90329.1 Holliday junction branch migration protein RuvA [Corynebacterium poyangense]
MIASLRGTVIDITLQGAVVECAGVGYFFSATPQTLSTLVRGEETTVITSMVVRESDIQLFGFLDAASREMFHALQTVSGLGPKLALAVQSVLGPEEIAHAITQGDTRMLQRVPGVGKRMAERMIVDLKDKMKPFHAVASTDLSGDSADSRQPAGQGNFVSAQVIEALMSLGFNEKTAGQAADKVLSTNPEADTSTALRAALSLLGGKR